MKKLRTVVYIDGFNLYYRVKHTAYKWLNLQKLSEIYLNLEKHDIIKIKYFTALVKGTLEDHFNITRQHIIYEPSEHFLIWKLFLATLKNDKSQELASAMKVGSI